ncbi:TonB-dependent receptor [Terrimonas sp. NA20]|uniref:TonB-dependent receptor n=1 Tax=Terrimonas ginsenosidimutans TaxID=2908004 RepID=A0ABS9KQ66_9BACT|nr:TonB-dependent receptor [Terrimonas ginsenosidimutans]MCG2614467.1 TonB-dependent receptor [Terrimonas ginsenosidimutans]
MRKLLVVLTAVLLLTGQLLAQRSITGKVVDEKGDPIPNASVSIKGTTSGVVTNEQGNFTLTLTPNAKTLVISSVNMGTEEVAVGSQNVINVTLKLEDRALQEVVVTGYGSQKKANVTGSIASIKAADIENRPFTSIDKGIQGMVAGLQSVAGSGQPGSSQAILIRGISSINAGTGPLWVIDGIPVNSGDASRLQTTANLLSTLNPNDVESITVLKDAASQSIYGSRAANGVIVVTTKKGKAGKTVFRFDTEVGSNSTAYKNDKYRPLNSAEYFQLTQEGMVNAGYTAAQQTTTLNGLGYNGGNFSDFSWLDAVERSGAQQQYNISAQGGNDKTTFFLSGGHFYQQGTSINSQLRRTNANVRVQHKLDEKLSFNMNVNGGFANQRAPLNGGAFGNPILSSYFLLPSRPAYNADGSYNFSNLGGLHNVIALSEIDKRFLRQSSLRGTLSGEYKILPNLKFRSSYGADYNVLEEDQYNNPTHGDGAASNGRAFAYYTRYYNWVWTNTLDFDQALNRSGDLMLNAQVGYESQKSNAYFISVQSQDFPPNFNLTMPAVGSRPTTSSATISEYSFLSQFASATLNYQNRFILSGTFRRDGSSRFGANNKYGNFGSVGLAWNIEKEAFMENVDFISQLKLRSSYGINGNANIGNYDWLTLYGYGANYNQLPGSAPSNVGDSSLTWELNKPWNVGVDVSFLKGRINLTADYYIRKSEDLLLNVPLSRTSGFSSRTRNLGAMENKGIEVTINATPVRTRDFSWVVDFNFAHNTNKITSLPGGNDIADGSFIIRQGEAYRTFFLREYAGVDPANGAPLWYTGPDHAATTGTYPGAGARATLGNALPKYFGGFTNTFSYKGLTLDIQLYYNFGNYVYDSWGSYYLGSGFGATYNKVARQLDRWTAAGQTTDIPRYVYGGNNAFQSASTFYLNQGDFVRLRNLQLGYTLPKNLISKIKLTNAVVYVRGANLFTWVKDKNLPFDPEQGTTSTSNLNVFIPKTISAGINVSF